NYKMFLYFYFFFSSRRRHTRLQGDWSSDVCSSDLARLAAHAIRAGSREFIREGQRAIEGHATHRVRGEPRRVQPPSGIRVAAIRSEERRVGKECRGQMWSEW